MISGKAHDEKGQERGWFSEHWKEGPGKGKYPQQGKGIENGMGMQRQTKAEKGMEIALGQRRY